MYEPLYDEYAGRLHAYCWSLVGEEAPGAVRDAFVTAARRGGPRGPVAARETELWLYGLARTACLRRDTIYTVRYADPLDRAAAALRPDQREALILASAERLTPAEIASLLGVAPDTVAQLLRTGRTRLERGVLDALLPGPVLPQHEHILAAFEKGSLDALLASRMPAEPPADLRDVILISCAAEVTHPLATPRVTFAVPERSTRPTKMLKAPKTTKAPTSKRPPVRKRPARVAGAVGLAAGVAVATGLFTTLVSASTNEGVTQSGTRHVSALGGHSASHTTGRTASTPQQTGSSPTSATARPNLSTPPGVLPPTTTSATAPQATAQPQPTRPTTPGTTAATPPTPPVTPSSTPTTPTPTPSTTPSTTPTPTPTPSTTP